MSSQTTSARLVQIDFKKRRPYQRVGLGVYKDTRTGNFYERPKIRGRKTWRKLASTTIRYAEQEVARNRTDQRLAGKGLAHDPYKVEAAARSVGDILDFYLENDCPKARSSGDDRKNLATEKTIVETLRQWWGKKSVDAIRGEDCSDYFKWRTPRINALRGDGRRMIDLELTSLSNAFRLASQHTRRTGVVANPIKDRPRFYNPKKAQHCREFQPESGNELHALARMLFQHWKSAALGWQLLYEAMIGQRTHEILKLRRDAKNEFEAGFIREDSLFLYRASGETKNTFPYAHIHPALASCIEAHKRWLEKNYPQSPWFFPSPVDPMKPVDSGSLTKTLARITPAMGLPKRTSHGLRSFCVNVYRSMKRADGSRKYSDAEIAIMIGHESGSGGKLVVTTYGQCMRYALSWMPERVKGQKAQPPAWAVLAAPEEPSPRAPRPQALQITFPGFTQQLVQTEFPF